ncbi:MULTISPECIES: hypothetical protein [unclassified Streptomyces]|uniref:hypothetical protein n=1 Tax=unclassified Streptomyces TaxID=2593676 RepID=UPI0021C83500|nr:hypothetical protein [Streptomyces sp. wa22]
MSNDKPIPLEGIPVFTGNLATLDVKVTELTSAAETIATTTGDVHSSFGGLQAFYQAPEADQLFATTKPVETSGQTLKSDLKSIAGALSTYSDEVYPLVEKLREIKRDAGAFLVKINADDKWREDGDLIEENNQRRDEIAETLAAFQEAEVACYNKIVALVCLLPLKTSDGSDSKNQYGFDAETLKHAEGLPWGDPLVESTPGWQVWEHAWDFTKGFFVDGVWGTIKGLGTLVGVDGWDAAGQAWKGLAQLATGVAISLSPVAAVQFWTAKDEDLPTWLRESRTAVKETGKALIAYDQWGENPARAAGAVTFNVVTTVFTGGTGGAVAGGGKAALAAKALSAAGKVGRFVDPMTYIFKGAGFGLTKIGDVMTGLKGLGTIEIPPLPDNVFTLPEGAVRLSDGTVDLPAGTAIPEGAVRLADGTVRLPEGVIALPEGTLKNPFDEGAAYADREGNLYDESGNLVQRADQARVETPVRVPEMAGARDEAGSSAPAGHSSDSTHAHDSSGHGPGSDEVPGGGDRPDVPDGQDESVLPEFDGASSSEAADMATRRDFEARVSPESTIPAPPKEPGHYVLETGDPVYFSDGRTAIGYDRSTKVNFDYVRPLNGYHDVVVHGNNQGFFEPGRVNEAGSGFSAGDTHPTHIANAIRANPSYAGGPVRLVSCHTGTVTEGAFDVPAAQSVANELGVPVMAPTNKVGVSTRLGPGQTPTIFDGGYWRTFLPLAH